jgi:hypothetical protein
LWMVGERRRDVLHGPYMTKSGMAPRPQSRRLFRNVADMTNKDAFDLWWEWADKPVDNKPTIDAAVYDAVMALPPDERRDRAKVNAAVRDDLRLGPLRPAGSEDQYGVPKATE